MDAESQRDLQLLEAFEQKSTVTQRTLAAQLGIALGLTNLYVKRLIRKGYVKCVTIAPNRIGYLVTPRGLSVKARLTYEFMKYSIDFYRDVRRHLRHSLAEVVSGHKRVAVFGTGEVAELVYLLLKQMGLDLVAVFDVDATEHHFLGHRVHAIADQGAQTFDVLIVAVLEKPAAARKRVLAAGVPVEKLLMLQAQQAVPAPAADRAETRV